MPNPNDIGDAIIQDNPSGKGDISEESIAQLLGEVQVHTSHDTQPQQQQTIQTQEQAQTQTIGSVEYKASKATEKAKEHIVDTMLSHLTEYGILVDDSHTKDPNAILSFLISSIREKDKRIAQLIENSHAKEKANSEILKAKAEADKERDKLAHKLKACMEQAKEQSQNHQASSHAAKEEDGDNTDDTKSGTSSDVERSTNPAVANISDVDVYDEEDEYVPYEEKEEEEAGKTEEKIKTDLPSDIVPPKKMKKALKIAAVSLMFIAVGGTFFYFTIYKDFQRSGIISKSNSGLDDLEDDAMPKAIQAKTEKTKTETRKTEKAKEAARQQKEAQKRTAKSKAPATATTTPQKPPVTGISYGNDIDPAEASVYGVDTDRDIAFSCRLRAEYKPDYYVYYIKDELDDYELNPNMDAVYLEERNIVWNYSKDAKFTMVEKGKYLKSKLFTQCAAIKK